jgi:hypothetical protein
MRRTRALVGLSLIAGLTACGSARNAVSSAPAAPPAGATSCQPTVDAELTSIAARIEQQAVSGRNVVGTRNRLRASSALAAAVARGDAHAARVALKPLVLHQVVRIELFEGTRRLVTVGTAPAFSPVRVALRSGGRTVGSARFSVMGDRSFMGITHRLTGAQLLLHAGRRRVMGTLAPGATVPAHGTVTDHGVRYTTTTLPTRAFPAGALQISLLLPPAAPALCGSDAADTRLQTVGAVGRRLLQAEQGSAGGGSSMRYVERDAAFRRAAAAGDAAAVRAVVVGRFFAAHRYHIVRVRLTSGSHLVADVGGPYALAPATGTVRAPDGSVAGHVTISVQDDTGYIKLMHRFTGAAVQLRTASGVLVPGSTLDPGPASIPAHGAVSYAGRSYRTLSYDAPAFPSGPLHVSLLLPQ